MGGGRAEEEEEEEDEAAGATADSDGEGEGAGEELHRVSGVGVDRAGDPALPMDEGFHTMSHPASQHSHIRDRFCAADAQEE